MRNVLIVTTIFFTIACSTKKQVRDSLEVKTLPSPSDSLSAEPFLYTGEDGTIFLSWVEKKSGSHFFKFSKYQEGYWTEPKVIASDSVWFVNWADYPMISADGAGNFIAHVLSKSGKGTFAYDVKMFLSNDSGKTWDKSFVLHDDEKQAEHGFVSMLPYGDNFFVTWLDGRNTVMEGKGKMDHHEGHHGAMSLRAAIINSSGTKIKEWELDSKTCDCCQTTASITESGPVVIYRDRSDEEIRDISITRFENDVWSSPTAIYNDNWKIAGCPVNGPRSDAEGNSLAVAWFSAPEGQPQVNVIFSENGGKTFAAPVRIDEGNPIGRVDVIMLNKERAVVSWMETEEIRAVIVYKNGVKETPFIVATSSTSRASGFPQMTKSGNELIFAWTDDQEKRVKVSSVILSDI